MPDKRKDSIPSALPLSYPGKTECLTLRSCSEPITLLRQLRLHWLGHVYRMEDGRIPNDILYEELASRRRTEGRPQLSYKDVCKRDMKALNINTESWEDLAADCMIWRGTLNQHLKSGDEKLVNAELGKGAFRKERNNSNRPETTHKSHFCGRDCFSHIGLYSHKQRCNNRTKRTIRVYSHDQT